MICWETARNKTELIKALRKIVHMARIALNTGRIIEIDLKEMKELKFDKDKIALGKDKLSGICAGE